MAGAVGLLAGAGNLAYRNFEHRPSVTREEPRRVQGMPSRGDVLSADNQTLIDRSWRAGEA